jgi:hypothetical protein
MTTDRFHIPYEISVLTTYPMLIQLESPQATSGYMRDARLGIALPRSWYYLVLLCA